MNEAKLSSPSNEDGLLLHHQQQHNAALVVSDDDAKFLLQAAAGPADQTGIASLSTIASKSDPDVSVAAACCGDSLFAASPPPADHADNDGLSQLNSAQQTGQDSTNGSSYCCVPGTSFIFESHTATAAADDEATSITTIPDSGSALDLKPEPPVLHAAPPAYGLDMWAAAAAVSSGCQYFPLHQPRILPSHSVYQHPQLPPQIPQQLHRQHLPLHLQDTESGKMLILPSSLAANVEGSHASNACGSLMPSEAPKRCRTNLTEEQKVELEKVFVKSKYPDYPVVDELSRLVGLPYKKVLVWFKNRRAKEKRTHKADVDLCTIDQLHQHQQQLLQHRKTLPSTCNNSDNENGSSSVAEGEASSSYTAAAGVSISAFNAAVAAAAAAAVTQTQQQQQQHPLSQFPYAQYSAPMRKCTAAPQHQVAASPALQQLPPPPPPPPPMQGPPAATYWIEPAATVPGLMKYEPVGVPSAPLYHHYNYHPAFPAVHHHQQQHQPQFQPPPPPPPPPLTHHFVFVSAENMATQTSPTMLLDFTDNNDENNNNLHNANDDSHNNAIISPGNDVCYNLTACQTDSIGGVGVVDDDGGVFGLEDAGESLN
ncbi:hypothetical protein BOX15_Mlig008550g6 [Macrostomum lignano]|uniref:Homeobox domain-containing protein n=1 Tax=Macrostomum lignano TaxID=282301 RepID=A0A267DXS7_9PLAT|nr:hypothetical protein BOX15_Mlig008550g6 [Macrostomum lignano]